MIFRSVRPPGFIPLRNHEALDAVPKRGKIREVIAEGIRFLGDYVRRLKILMPTDKIQR